MANRLWGFGLKKIKYRKVPNIGRRPFKKKSYIRRRFEHRKMRYTEKSDTMEGFTQKKVVRNDYTREVVPYNKVLHIRRSGKVAE